MGRVPLLGALLPCRLPLPGAGRAAGGAWTRPRLHGPRVRVIVLRRVGRL